MRRYPPPLLGWLRFFYNSVVSWFSAFEVLSYRWGVAAIVLTLFGWCSGCNFRLAKKDLLVVFLLSLLRATTSFSLLIAYQNIATGVASTIHFMYPLAVSLAMMFSFMKEISFGDACCFNVFVWCCFTVIGRVGGEKL